MALGLSFIYEITSSLPFAETTFLPKGVSCNKLSFKKRTIPVKLLPSITTCLLFLPLSTAVSSAMVKTESFDFLFTTTAMAL